MFHPPGYPADDPWKVDDILPSIAPNPPHFDLIDIASRKT